VGKRVGDHTGVTELGRDGVSNKTAVVTVLVIAAFILVACSTPSATTTARTTTTTTSSGSVWTPNSITNTVLGAGVVHCDSGDTVGFPPPGEVDQWKPTCRHYHGTTTTTTTTTTTAIIPIINVGGPPVHAIPPPCTATFVVRGEPCVDIEGQVVTAS
jgi:hypothetical protein